jgi:hypothetical protein
MKRAAPVFVYRERLFFWARSISKVLIKLFQKFAGSRGRALVDARRHRNTPVYPFGKIGAWGKFHFFKRAAFPIQNRIRAADTSL